MITERGLHPEVAPAMPERDLADVRRLHIGCGVDAAPGWINTDGSMVVKANRMTDGALARLTPVLQRVGVLPAEMTNWGNDVYYLDITKRWNVPDASVGAVFSSHVLEHVRREDVPFVLQEAHRVLSSGGALRVVVPDLEAIIDAYKGQREFPLMEDAVQSGKVVRADAVMREIFHRDFSGAKGNPVKSFYRKHFGSHEHQWMYDKESMQALFAEAGFIDIQSMDHLDTRIPGGVAGVERDYRVTNGRGICIEGIKP